MPRDVIMPALGMSQDTAEIVAWLKRPGDPVRAGEALMEVETDKAVVEVEAQADGFLANVSALAGAQVPVGHVVAMIVDRVDTPDAHDTDVAPAAADPESAASSAAGEDEIADRPDAVESRRPEDTTREVATRAASGLPRSERRADTPGETVAAEFPSDETVRGETGSAKRILASPKTRRLALERGLSLANLVAMGVPQPYHVADLDTLESAGPVSAAGGRSAHAWSMQAPVMMQIQARVPASTCDAFIAWMATEEGVDASAISVWLRFATAALRRTTDGEADGLVVEVRPANGQREQFVDADRSRMSQPLIDVDVAQPDLVMRDFTDSAIVAANAPVGGVAAVTLGRENDDFVIAFDYPVDQLAEDAALRFTTDFADRLGEPLLHLF